MIYVLKSAAFDENENYVNLIKIGYTDNWERRLSQYKLHNPTIKVLYKIEDGNEEDEKSLHSYFSEYKYSDYGNEWFYYNDSIVKFFENKTIEEMRKLFVKPEKKLTKNEIRLLKFNELLSNLEDNDVNREVKKFFNEYNLIGNERMKLKFFCESSLSDQVKNVVKGLVSNRVKNYLSIGEDRLKALNYNTSDIRKELSIITFDKSLLKSSILNNFKISDRFSKSKIKEKLSMIYDQIGYKKTPKANDLEEWFEIKDILMTENNKRVHGFEIIKKKGEGN